MAIPQWTTPVGTLGTIQESVYYTTTLVATDADLDTLTYTLQAGSLPNGMVLSSDGIISGTPFALDLATESKFTVRVTDGTNINERTFSLLVEGMDAPTYITNPGLIATYFDCQVVSEQLSAIDLDPGDTISYKLIAGKMPPGVTLNETTGLISGFVNKIEPQITPINVDVVVELVGFANHDFYDTQPWDIETDTLQTITLTGESKYDNTGFDIGSYEFNSKGQSREFVFTTEITDDKIFVTQDNSIFIYSNDELITNTTNYTSDNAVLTADSTIARTPVLLETAGDIGTVRHDNYYAKYFSAIDCDDEALEWEIGTGTLPPGLSMNIYTGWLSGNLPTVGVAETDYAFTLRVKKKNDPTFISGWSSYTMTVKGDLELGIVWLTDADLGVVATGDISQLYVEATAAEYISLIYEFDSQFGIKSGSIPQGIIVQEDGTIEGRFSFRTFGLDQKSTTFDTNTTTVDKTYTFDVTVRDTNNYINVKKQFSVKVLDTNYEPYENMYLTASNNPADRETFNGFINDGAIFPKELVYRPFDFYHGVQSELRMLLISGLKAETTETFISEMEHNFFKKKILMGDIKKARAVNSLGAVVYEVIYVDVHDQFVNADGTSQSNIIELSNTINAEIDINITGIKIDSTILTIDQSDYQYVWSNSFENMRNEINVNVGFILEQASSLPLWMRSEQEDGKILDWVPAIPICYTIPGGGNQVMFNITESGFNFQDLNFEVNKVEWDNNLSKSFNKTTRKFSTSNMTTFDRETSGEGYFDTVETTWDEESARWISNVDTYIVDVDGDEYLGFPKQGIFK